MLQYLLQLNAIHFTQDHQFSIFIVLSVIYIDFNYEGSRAEKSHRSLDQVAYEDGSNGARTSFTDSYGNPVVYDTLDDVDAGKPSKNKNQPFNYVIPGYASGILEENETPTRSTILDTQESRNINDDRIRFVDPQRNFFIQSSNNPPLLPSLPVAESLRPNAIENSQTNDDTSFQDVRIAPSQGILPPIDDPLNPENIHLPSDTHKSEGVPAVNIENDNSKPHFFRLRPPIEDPLLPHNIQLPADPQKSEGVPALNNKPHFFRLRPAIEDPLLPHNIQLPSDPQKSEGLPATIFQNDNSVSHGLLPPIDDPLNPENINLPPNPQASEGVSATFFQNDRSSVSQGILPPINDPLHPDNINLPLNSQKSEGFPLPRNGNSPSEGLEPPQLPNIDNSPSFSSNPFLPPAVNTFNHPKTSTFNSNSNDGPVIITDDQIAFAPRPSNGLQPPKDPQQDVNINFRAPTIPTPIPSVPTTTKFNAGNFNRASTTQQTQIPVVVLQFPQVPKVDLNKYKGTFGGPPGVLTSSDSQFIAPTQESPQTSPSISSVTINKRFQGTFGGSVGVLGGDDRLPAPSTTQNTFTTFNSGGNVISERSVNKYQGSFGGPSGVLQPFDNKSKL